MLVDVEKLERNSSLIVNFNIFAKLELEAWSWIRDRGLENADVTRWCSEQNNNNLYLTFEHE